SEMNKKCAMKRAAVTIRSEWFATPSRKRRLRTEARGLRRASSRATGTLAELTSTLRGRVVDPFARVDDDEQRHGERDSEEQHRERGRVAHVEVPEPLLVQEHGVEERRALRIAVVVDGLVACLGRLARGDVRGDVRLREVLQPRDHPD